jgi:hypothetical protein
VPTSTINELAHINADFRERVEGRFDLLERLIVGGTSMGLERTAAALTAAAATLRNEGLADGLVTDKSDTSDERDTSSPASDLS